MATLKQNTNVVHRFASGDEVLVLHPQPMFGPEIPHTAAIVLRREPYLGRPGYYVSFPDATEMWHCHGGWKPESVLRGTERATRL